MAKADISNMHRCGDCRHVVPVYRHNTLTVKDKKPTLGECPFWTSSRSVLLSQFSPCEHFESK